MIKSQYILDILSLILDGNDIDSKLKKQIKFISEKNRQHTGAGVFIYFDHDKDIFKCKVNQDIVLNGLKIYSKEYDLEAEVNLFTKDGLLDYLEILAIAGSYPIEDPKKYIVKQIWLNSPNREIVREN